jgi:hypothetical protein
MSAWDKFKTILNGWGKPLWPDAKPLPDHVKNVRIDQRFMRLHMHEAEKPKARNGFKFDES